MTLARKLIGLSTRTRSSNLPSAIFGSVGGLQIEGQRRLKYRVGMWSLVSADAEAAMGIWTALAYLLEDYESIEVYRIFAKLDGEPDDYQWDISKSQFSVDDWEVEGLNENVALWGQLENTQDNYHLAVSIENDLNQAGEDVLSLSYTFPNFSAILSALPAIAFEIARVLLPEVERLLPPYQTTEFDETVTRRLLPLVFRWEVNLLLSLWGVEWDDDDILEMQARLLSFAGVDANEFTSWVVAKAIARAMLPGNSLVGELVVEQLSDLTRQLGKQLPSALVLSSALYGFGYPERAYALLESKVPDAQEVAFWETLANLYRQGNRLAEAVDTYQRAIEKDIVSTGLFSGYADTLVVADYAGALIDTFILIDPSEYSERRLIWEAIEAYDESLHMKNSVSVLYRQALQLIELDEGLFWDDFELLIDQDSAGAYIRELVDNLDETTDVAPGIFILEEKVEDEPNRVDLRIDLTLLYILANRLQDARKSLETAKELSVEDEDQLGEIERLFLSVDDPNFEQRFGEIATVAEAGNRISAKDLAYVENAIETAPSFLEGYLVLARSYTLWDDSETAIELLLDANEQIPGEPEIYNLLAEAFWKSDEASLAFQYLTEGLRINPNYIPLLANGALYLFTNGQPEDARVYLARAEMIQTNHPHLARVRNYIARQLNNSS